MDGTEGSTLGEVAAATTPTEVPSPEVASTETATPEFDYSPYADQLVTLKVDGQDLKVPLKQALEGHMRQEAFTRKTQELAEQRKGLQQAEALVAALQRDPARTLQVLQEAYGIKQETSQEDEFQTPEEKRLRDLEQFRAQQEGFARQQQIDRELSTLRSQYGDFDEQALFVFALQKGHNDLLTAYRDMTYDTIRQETVAARENQHALAEQAVVDAKRQQAAVVSSGTGTQQGATAKAQGKPGSVREAWKNSLAELGLSHL